MFGPYYVTKGTLLQPSAGCNAIEVRVKQSLNDNLASQALSRSLSVNVPKLRNEVEAQAFALNLLAEIEIDIIAWGSALVQNRRIAESALPHEDFCDCASCYW